MKPFFSSLLCLSLSILGYLRSTSEVATAQVTPDNTVNTQVNQKGKVAEITGGAAKGGQSLS